MKKDREVFISRKRPICNIQLSTRIHNNFPSSNLKYSSSILSIFKEVESWSKWKNRGSKHFVDQLVFRQLDGFVANSMQLFQSISICEIKCYREHIKSNKVLFIGTQKSYSLFQSRGKNWLISFKTLGREWNLQGEKWAKFYPRSWDWTSGRIIWELIQVTFGHCPFDW